ncbi:MAG: beta-ketoacyl-[acyl-carrier-protein] synthase family protein, partial [Sciscionella sp.]
PSPDCEGYGYWSVVRDFDPTEWMTPQIESGTDSFSQYALCAAAQALEHAGLDGLDPLRTAVVHGTSSGGSRALTRNQHLLDTRGVSAIDRKMMIQVLPNMASAQIAMRYGLHGPQVTLTSACASALDAIGHARCLLEAGTVDVVLVGATEGGLAGKGGMAEGDFVPVQYQAQSRFGMNSGAPDATMASLPFDVRRSGIVTGEGSAMFVMETAEHARSRGIEPVLSVRGYASLADSYHPSSPDPTGQWQARTMRLAQSDAGIGAAAVDALVAHATATPKGDFAEITAINQVFEDAAPGLPVMSVKGHLGHPGAASGGLGAIVAASSVADGIFPHIAGTKELEPNIRFHVVTEQPHHGTFDLCQINAFGFGGQNASLVVSAPR